MAEVIATYKHKRIPCVAAALSLVVTGLGHWYCGRIIKGLLFNFLSTVFLPVFLWAIFVSHSATRTVIAAISLAAACGVDIIALIDSYYVAKNTRPDYQLKDYNRWYVYLLVVLVNIAAASGSSFNVRANFMQSFRCVSQNMAPNLIKGDRVLANKTVYRTETVERGDIVIFHGFKGRRKLIRRVVAIGGDTIEIKSGALYVNGEQLERLSVSASELTALKDIIDREVLYEVNGDAKYLILPTKPGKDNLQASRDFEKMEVPPGHCFVLCDNRDVNHDSRQFGPVPLASIKGRIGHIYWPAKDWSRFGSLRPR